MQRSLTLPIMMIFDTRNGATNSGNCASSRCNLATALYHNSTLQTPSSGIGLTLSAATTGCIPTEPQVACQRSAFEHSMKSVSTGGQPRLIGTTGRQVMLLGKHCLKNCVNTRRNSPTASRHNSTLTNPGSCFGFRSSATTIGCNKKESQVP